MPRPKRRTPASFPKKQLWENAGASTPILPEDKAAPLSEKDLVRMFRAFVRKLIPGDWVAYELYPMPGVRQDLNRPPVADDDTLAIMAYRPMNGESPLLFIPLTDTLKMSHLDRYRGHIENIQKWFYREFPPVNAARIEKWYLCKMVNDSGIGYTALARYLNDSATQVIQEVVRASESTPPRRRNPKKLKDRLTVFGYGGKAETIIEEAVALCRSGSQPFEDGLPFDIDRVKEYLRRWEKEQQ